MGFAAKILADSISDRGHRMTSFEVTFPRFILAEVNTHRMLSKNSASSRAIPTEKIIDRVTSEPFVPIFNKRVKGMGVGSELDNLGQLQARATWHEARNTSVRVAKAMIELDKSRVNRLLEPWMWHTAILSGTDWGNFFALRIAEDAQPEFFEIASMMKTAYDESKPKTLDAGQWHLPLVNKDELSSISSDSDRLQWMQISIGRCARVSYLTHDGHRDINADIDLFNKLIAGKPHLSPFEHVATPFRERDWMMLDQMRNAIENDTLFTEYLMRQVEYHGNLHGWHSARTLVSNEHDASLNKE